jgi:RNA polymerase sigma-70 factor (ECF subfamily)
VVPGDSQFQELIRRVRDRDDSAAAELVRHYEGAIRRVIRIHLRDVRLRKVLDSMDICQSVLATFFVRTALGEYELDSPEQLMRLLISIARNKLTNQAHRLRAQKRDVRREAAIAPGDSERILDPASDPSEQASVKEILQKVRTRLKEEELYLADQRALGRPWKELAEELGGTDVALRKKLTRAVGRVMAELGLDEVANE